MKRAYNIYFLFLCLLLSCFQSDNEESLLSPKFERCMLKAEYVNGKKSIEVTSKDGIIEKVSFFKPDGTLSVVRKYEYKDGRISKISDTNSSWTYTYNDRRDLEKEDYCSISDNNCCTTTMEYNYTGSACPIVSRIINCTSGYYLKYEYKYLNQYSCSNFSFAEKKDGTASDPDSESVIKYENINNPYILIFPGEDYYLSEIYNKGSNSTTNAVTEVNSSGYPLEIESLFNNVKFVYTYEYECK